jgi:hypothetical protein
MFRKDLITVLLDNPLRLSEIARLYDVPLKEVLDDVKHLRKTPSNLPIGSMSLQRNAASAALSFPQRSSQSRVNVRNAGAPGWKSLSSRSSRREACIVLW